MTLCKISSSLPPFWLVSTYFRLVYLQLMPVYVLQWHNLPQKSSICQLLCIRRWSYMTIFIQHHGLPCHRICRARLIFFWWSESNMWTWRVIQDKHSRKGLQEMVQRRKKYLKYLRRTDWDSYCLVLSKLGLRDVPEYKPPDYKSKRSSSGKTKAKRKIKRKMKA